MLRLIDTHAHLNLPEFSQDWRQVAADSLAQGVFVINAGVDYATSVKAIEIAQNFEFGIYAAIGMHPENIIESVKDNSTQEYDFDNEKYSELLRTSKKIVAVGEIGLDYLRLPKNSERREQIKNQQALVFKKQLAFARENNLPVMLHSRLCGNDMLKILSQEQGSIRGVLHCFNGSVDEIKHYCGLGLYFGLNGIIFKTDLSQAIAQIPIERILLETDCPYLSPIADIRRNEPRFALEVARRVAEIRNDNLENIIAASTRNAQKLFLIND
jgi:TatD DNase family protein